MSRPSFTQPVGGTVKITIPPEWFINASAISRKNYNQGVFVQTSIRNGRVTNFFASGPTESGPMLDVAQRLATFPIAPRQEVVVLDLTFYYATSTSPVEPASLRAPQYVSNTLDVHRSTKPVGASDDIPDYVTFFIFCEDTPDNQQVSGSGKFDDSVCTIHCVKTNPNPIPPSPPSDTIKPYNPVLDLPRPSKFENYLREYDVSFLIDDSGSMANENRWTEGRNALNGLANAVIDSGFDYNGIDLSFLNSNAKFAMRDEVHDITDKDKVAAAMDKITPAGGTPTGARVATLLNAHIDRLEATKGTQAYAEIKPLNLIVITDGAPTDPPESELTQMLINAGQRIKNGKHHPNSLGVQFVQIGSDPAAATALPKLIQADTGNMVDTVPYKGPGSISPDGLERILLGALHPNIRAQRIP